MEYRYKVLEKVLLSIAKDSSTENIFDQVEMLTRDERMKLRELLHVCFYAEEHAARSQGELV